MSNHPKDDSDSGNDAKKFWREKLNGARYVMAPMVDMSELSFRMLGESAAVDSLFSSTMYVFKGFLPFLTFLTRKKYKTNE